MRKNATEQTFMTTGKMWLAAGLASVLAACASMGGARPDGMNFRVESAKLAYEALKSNASAATPAEATKQTEPAH